MAKDYRHLRAWCRLMGSYDYYVQGELEAARRDKAPADVIYRKAGSETAPDGESWRGWRRFASVTNDNTRALIEAILADMPE